MDFFILNVLLDFCEFKVCFVTLVARIKSAACNRVFKHGGREGEREGASEHTSKAQ